MGCNYGSFSTSRQRGSGEISEVCGHFEDEKKEINSRSSNSAPNHAAGGEVTLASIKVIRNRYPGLEGVAQSSPIPSEIPKALNHGYTG